MADFVKLISSYNLINYFLPGILFFIGIKYFLNIDFSLNSDFYSFAVCYFAGLIISRIGSLLLEPALKNIGFLKFAGYDEYCEAENSDKSGKLQILSKVNNSFRSYTIVFFALFVIKLVKILICPKGFGDFIYIVALFALFLLFLFSYRKQTKYMVDYVNNKINSKKGEQHVC